MTLLYGLVPPSPVCSWTGLPQPLFLCLVNIVFASQNVHLGSNTYHAGECVQHIWYIWCWVPTNIRTCVRTYRTICTYSTVRSVHTVNIGNTVHTLHTVRSVHKRIRTAPYLYRTVLHMGPIDILSGSLIYFIGIYM